MCPRGVVLFPANGAGRADEKFIGIAWMGVPEAHRGAAGGRCGFTPATTRPTNRTGGHVRSGPAWLVPAGGSEATGVDEGSRRSEQWDDSSARMVCAAWPTWT